MKIPPDLGYHLDQRLRQLASISSSTEYVTRLAFTPEMTAANAIVAEWMREAGMEVRLDPAGNLIGRYEGETPGLPALLLGSHLDTVENAGRFDGMLGVVVAIWCVTWFHQQARRFPFAIEVLAFGDEEGVRFGTSTLGSLAFAGKLDPERLKLQDRYGQTVTQAIEAFGFDSSSLMNAARLKEDVLGYVEVHIEQGPMLETLNLPVACVSGISGSKRIKFDVFGNAGHAGTVPMEMRHDALAAAAEMILTVESLTSEFNVVATVGTIAVAPSAVNVIPGATTFTLDLRSLDDADRIAYLKALRARISEIAARREVKVTESIMSESKSAPCAMVLQRAISLAIERAGFPVATIPSGAGHDGAMLSPLVDFGMIFVRCKGGISHHPDEFVSEDDIATSALALRNFVEAFSELG
jgi:allantoate deiminase